MPGTNRSNPNQGRVYGVKGLSPTLTNIGGGGARQPHIIVAKDDDDSDDNEDNDLYLGNIYGEHIHDGFGCAVFDGYGCCPTIKTCQGGNRQPLIAERERESNEMKYRIRRITPLEAFRLMGVSDEDFKKAEKVASNTGLYKTAGNGIVKSCLEAIFCSMNIVGVPSWEEYSKKYT